MAYDKKNLTRVPDLDASDEEILSFFDHHFNDDSVYRCRQLERMARNLHYFVGRQWIELDTEAIPDGVRGYIFRDTPQPDAVALPRPVINRIAPTVEVEMATLGKRQLVPTVVSKSSDPRMIAAATVAKDILNDRLKKLSWDDLREAVTFLTIVTGVGVLKSWWDEVYTDTTLVASPDAVKCPNCPTTLATRTVPKDRLEGLKNTETAYGETEESVQLNACPTCDTPVPLVPTELDEEQAGGADVLGRPLGFYVPKGNTNLEVVSPFDVFPENGGIDVGPKNFKFMGQASVRSLDWVEERYPEYCEDITPDEASELLHLHPVLGEWNYMGRYDEALDSGVYDNHVRVFEIHHEKSYRFPEGRSLVVVGENSKKIVRNGPLYRKNEEGVDVPMVRYSVAGFKPGRHKEFWAQSLVDDLISPQNRINGLDAQVVEARERLGSPNILATNGMELDDPSWFTDYGLGKIMRWNIDPMQPTAKPETFGGTVMPTQVYEERDRIIQDMRDIAGPQDVEIGEAPKNISTTSGLQLLGEQAERRRATRERALVSMYEESWEHQLKLLWCLREEVDEYETESASGAWETEQYDRMAIAGQTKVKVEKQAYVDKSIYAKEAAREALADGLIIIDSQLARKKLLELMNLPTDINEDLNKQVDVGQKQWTDFIDKMSIPVIDPGLDEFRIRYQTLGTFLLSDEGQLLQEQVGWKDTLKKIAGWQDELAMMEMRDLQAFQFYGTRDPQQAQPIYEQAQASFEQQQMSYEQQVQASEQLTVDAQQPAPLVEPPMPPPPPTFLPAAKEDRIYQIWQMMLMKFPPEETSIQGMVKDSFLRFRAVVEAYRLLAEEKEMKMAMGAPGMQAPGTPGGSPGIGGALPGVQPQQQVNFPGPPQPNNPTNVPGGKDKNITQGFKM